MNQYFDEMTNGWDSDSLKVQRASITAQHIKALNFVECQRCVDFGSGTGLLGIQLRDVFDEVILADASHNMLNVAQRKLTQAQVSNVRTLPVSGVSDIAPATSVIVTLMTLHHIDDTAQFLADALQRLSPLGSLVIADLYAEDGAFHKHNLSFTGHNGFDPQALITLANEVGFSLQAFVPHYYEIWQENYALQRVAYPLFMLVLQKTA